MLLLTREHYLQMEADVRQRWPEEACGLVGGRLPRAGKIFPIANDLASPTRFRMNPTQQIAAFNEIEQKKWDLLAVYHSHPQGPDFPSETDIAECAYPDIVHLIWSPRGDSWQARGFYIRNGKAHETEIEIVE